MGPTTFFGTIHRSHYTISSNFYLYLQYFQQKVFSFNKISVFQTNPKKSCFRYFFGLCPIHTFKLRSQGVSTLGFEWMSKRESVFSGEEYLICFVF